MMRYYVYGFRGSDEFFGLLRDGREVGTEVSARRREGWVENWRRL